MGAKGAAGVGFGRGCNGLRSAGNDELAALVTAFGAKVEDPIGALDDIEVVFDDEDGVAGLDEALEAIE